MDDDKLQPTVIGEEQFCKEVEVTKTKSFLRLECGVKKFASKILIQASFNDAHNVLKLELKAKWKKSSLREAIGRD